MGLDLPLLMSHAGSSGFSLLFHELSSPTILGKAWIFSKNVPPLDMGKFLDFVFNGLAYTSVTPCHTPPQMPPRVLCSHHIKCKCPCLALSTSHHIHLLLILWMWHAHFASILLLIFILSKMVSFILLRAAQSSQVPPPSSNSSWWPLFHARSSALNFNTRDKPSPQGSATHYALTCSHFFKVSELRAFKLNHVRNG